MGKRRWGIAFFAAALLMSGWLAVPFIASAAEGSSPILRVGQTPMEAQMLGEKPFQPQTSALTGATRPGQESAKIALPYNLEMGISFKYHQDPALDVSRRPAASMFFNYSMDYRLLPNLKVGLHGYLYRYDTGGENLTFSRSLGDTALGLGPGLRYDLGRWSFIMKAQVEANRERGESGLQNWFRVWYAF